MLDHKTTTYDSLPHGKRSRRQAPTKINGAHLLTLVIFRTRLNEPEDRKSGG